MADPKARLERAWVCRELRELIEWIRIPSVSADPSRRADVRRAAYWAAAFLRRAGLSRVRLISTPGNPLVYGEWKGAPGAPTLLVYGHADVQPAVRSDGWSSDPFMPVLREGFLYGRGASDDKGQVFCHLAAIRRELELRGRLPVNVKVLLDGEEEVGSPNLGPFLRRNRVALAADAAVMSDTRMLSPTRPAIAYGLRGGLGVEITVRGGPRDVHQGHFGGAIENPAHVLARMIAGLHGPDGRVAIPGWYRSVRAVGPGERDRLRRVGPSDQALFAAAGVQRGSGERGYSALERATIRPDAAVNGISAGYQGPGPKAIIPARASAKIRFRLVPDQTVGEAERLVRDYIARATPPTVRADVKAQVRIQPALVDPRHPAVRAAVEAYRVGFGRAAALVRSGGSVPIVNMLREHLGIPTVLMGFAVDADRAHGPDERFSLNRLRRGIATSIAFLHELGRDRSRGFRPWHGRREKASLVFEDR